MWLFIADGSFEIVDEKDKVEDMQQYAMDRWKARQEKYQILKDDATNPARVASIYL